jgi:UDP-N-acetylmuramyl pentapeptide phosphotransferase/UDP-N-acetylglucosamine-1-phosphate transferase
MIFTFLISVTIAALLCAIVLATKPLHVKRTAKGHTSAAKQSSHRVPTPRIGGLGILAFPIVALFLKGETSELIFLLSVSALPVFLGGFGEDTGFDVSPRTRLLLSFCSAAIAGVLLNAWVDRTGIPLLDIAFSFTLISIAFTLLMSGGLCHAINLVDGLNGLSIGLSIIMLGAFSIISTAVGDTAMVKLCMILMGAMLGILVFNFPSGKIFLGDAGAYTIGHFLTWIAILLMARNPEIAPFAMFLIFFWPVADMLFAILRRLRNGKPIDQPDRMHFHQFVMRAIELTVVNRRSISNPLATATIWPLASIPIIFAVSFHNANLLAAVAWIICFFVFIWTYVAGIRLARYLSRARRGEENLLKTIGREGFVNLRDVVDGDKIYPAE